MRLQAVQERGVTAWTSMIFVCWTCAGIFPTLSLMGGTLPSVFRIWQPVVVGGLFLAGQLLMFLAVSRGDVSIAAPVLGVKVLMVPAAALFIVQEQLPMRIWTAAAIAVVGIALVQARDATIHRSRVAASVLFALLAASAMTLFDLFIQKWAADWGAGYLLPLAFISAALWSLAFLPLANRPLELRRLGVMRPLLIGALIMAVQAIGMTLALGLFGDATRVNIVYSLRGVWGVVIPWMVAHQRDASRAPSHRTMAVRLIGAVLIGISAVIAVT